MRRRLLLMVPALLASLAAARAQGPNWIVDRAWVKPSLEGALNSVAYFTLVNRTGSADRLLAVTTPVAARAELHRDEMKDGVMAMRATGPLALAPGARVVLAPGGFYLMLIGLKQPLRPGDHFPVTLTFEHSAPLTVELPVLAGPPS